MPGQPIILVDDNHDDLFILKRLLSRAELKNPFVSFDSAEEAKLFLNAALRTPDTNLVPAAIFSDKSMPNFDGFALLEWVRRQPKLRTIPFILMTSTGAPDDAQRAEKLGVTHFFEKFHRITCWLNCSNPKLPDAPIAVRASAAVCGTA